MIHLLVGSQNVLLEKEAKLQIKELVGETDVFNFVSFDGREVTIQKIVEEACNLPLGYEKKAIIVSNPYYLTTAREKFTIEKDQNYGKFFEYINNSNPDCELFFLVEGKMNTGKKDFLQALIKKAKRKDLEELTPAVLRRNVISLLEKRSVRIDDDALDELMKRSGGDFFAIKNNANKIALVASHLTFKDVDENIFIPLADNVFSVVEALLNQNTASALKNFSTVCALGYDGSGLLLTFVSQFKIILLVSYLLKNYSNDEIADILKVHPYRVKLASKNARILNFKKTLNIVCDLAKIEYDVRLSGDNCFERLELFILNFGDYFCK